MKQVFTVIIDVEVHDVQALYQRAKEQMIEDGFAEDEVPYFLGEQKEIDAGQCLIELLDRSENLAGASILNSSCEE